MADWKDIDWKSIVKTVAPGLATLLGGPLAGGAVTVLAEALLGGSTGSRAGDEIAIQQKLAAGLTPEDKAKIILAENEIKKEIIRAGIREKEIALETEKVYVGDTAHARDTHKANAGILRLGFWITALSYALVGAVLYGCYGLATGQMQSTLDPSLAMVIGSVVGAALQFVFMNASQAAGFFFGSSQGSRQMAVDLSKSVNDAVASSAKVKG
jgi:hypothetical protein